MQTPSENFLVSCGNWENSFQVISLSDGRMVQSIRQHKDVVSCVAGMFHGSERIHSLMTVINRLPLMCWNLLSCLLKREHASLKYGFFCDCLINEGM